MVFHKIIRRSLRGGDEIVIFGGNAEPFHFRNIIQNAFRGIVGHEKIGFPRTPDGFKKRFCERKQLIPEIERAVHVEKKQPDFGKIHKYTSYLNE